MSKSRNKSGSKRFGFKIILILGLVVYFSALIIGQQSDINALNGTIAEYNEKIDSKNSEIATMQDKKKNSLSDEMIENIARERLGLVRSDETVFVDITGK